MALFIDNAPALPPYMATLRISKNFIYTNGLMLCLAVSGFVVRYLRFPEVPLELHLFSLGVSLVVMAGIWYFFKWMDSFLNKVYPYERSIPLRITIQIAIGVVFILLVREFVFWWGTSRWPVQLDFLFRLSTYVVYILLSIGLNLGFFASYFLQQWKTSIQRAERLEREKTQVQFDNLKNQLNPHFLFNALTSLNSLIFEDQQLASDFLQHLSKVYRYVLQHKDKGLVPLKSELEFISSYVFLLETRFAPGLQLQFNIAEEALQKEIVPVTLQILIENAIKHNIINSARPLVITISACQHWLSVRNNLQKKKLIESSNEQGLENLSSLYKFISKSPILISSDVNNFEIKIPLL